MASVNKVVLLGRLGRDPETRYASDGGTPICHLAVATSRRYKDRNGERQEETEWHIVVLFGRAAEIAQQYLLKGSEVYIEGRLRTRSYEKDGIERYVTEIVCESLQLGARPASGATEAADSRPATEYRRPTNVNRPGPAAPTGDLPNDDIEF